MDLKQKLFSIEETKKLLSIDVMEIRRLIDENELTKCTAITGASIRQFAARKNLTLAVEA